MVFQSHGPVSFTKTTLSYPVYAAEFDPYNRGFLVVGGGGGQGRSGVANKIVSCPTLLDASKRSTLDTTAEIELSSEEDSITSLATLASKDGLITLAGINSSESDQKAGKNQHLRTFDIKYPRKKQTSDEKEDSEAQDGNISFIGKASLFQPATGPKPETYQRVLRLSPTYKRDSPNKRIGAVATGLAKQSEIVVFDATRTPTTDAEIIARIPMRDNAEAADLDITELETNTFSITWATDYDVYEQTVMYNFDTKKASFSPANPRKVYSMPKIEDAKKPIRPKYRAIRWLGNEDVLLLSNLPNRTGAELSIIHFYPSGPALKVKHKVLPGHVKQAVGLDVCSLDSDKAGNKQIVVAIAGHDISIPVYTLDYNANTHTFGSFKRFTTLRDVHPLQMTCLRFSPFHSPVRAPPPEQDRKGNALPIKNPVHPGPQYIKLCSTSMGNTVVVDTFALLPSQPSDRQSRYVLLHPSEELRQRTTYGILIGFAVLIFAILLQSMYSTDPFAPGLADYIPLPASWQRTLSHPASIADSMGRKGWEPIVDAASSCFLCRIFRLLCRSLCSFCRILCSRFPGVRIADLLDMHFALPGGSKSADDKAVIVRDQGEGKSLAVHMGDKKEYMQQDEKARHWHELNDEEQHVWRQRLVDAGHWTIEEGETILKGVVFSSWAGFVGRVAGEVIREL
ncbi:unnamed protein product [Aureobasidium vineae]|uniref:Guanine nucleotide-exchange factor SEC12 n=1 Tax=Aureobasidium vineae TaxID=2773715 RepID=A0A9N8PCL4_9PEZI|nr:unnamed protein product [Aureobasidium vineae]